MSNNSVTLHRVIKTNPEKIFRAFTDPNALSFWLPPYGFLCAVHQMDPRVGGGYKMSFTNFSTGNAHSFSGKFLEIKPNELSTPINLTILICLEKWLLQSDSKKFLAVQILKSFMKAFHQLFRRRCVI